MTDNQMTTLLQALLDHIKAVQSQFDYIRRQLLFVFVMLLIVAVNLVLLVLAKH